MPLLLSLSVALSNPPEVLSHLLHGTIILGRWYPHLDICFSVPEAGRLLQSLLMTKHQENFCLRWNWP